MIEVEIDHDGQDLVSQVKEIMLIFRRNNYQYVQLKADGRENIQFTDKLIKLLGKWAFIRESVVVYEEREIYYENKWKML